MKNSSIAVISAMFAVLSCSAFAESTCASKVIFSCTTTKGKTVEVCDAGSTIKYSFGKKGAPPEMVLAIPRRSRTSAGILTGVQTTAFSAFPKAVCLSRLEFPPVAPMFRCAWPS